MNRKQSVDIPCRIGPALEVFEGRWKGSILWWLQQGPKRFGELRRLLPAITQKVLTVQLRQLERDGLVHREAFPQVPPKVEYSLTSLCRSLLPLLAQIAAWGDRHQEEIELARRKYDAQ